jgi:hypothetical protein
MQVNIMGSSIFDNIQTRNEGDEKKYSNNQIMLLYCYNDR